MGLQENRAIPCVVLPLMCIIALFSWSLFLGLESFLGKVWIDRNRKARTHFPASLETQYHIIIIEMVYHSGIF